MKLNGNRTDSSLLMGYLPNSDIDFLFGVSDNLFNFPTINFKVHKFLDTLHYKLITLSKEKYKLKINLEICNKGREKHVPLNRILKNIQVKDVLANMYVCLVCF